MNKNEFFETIKDSFFDNLTCDFEGFKNMVSSALPVFGVLETKIINNDDDGSKSVKFFDVDEADLVIASKGTDIDDVNVDMTANIMTLHLNKNNVIEIVEHGFGIFTPANKNHVLLLASFIGKTIDFDS